MVTVKKKYGNLVNPLWLLCLYYIGYLVTINNNKNINIYITIVRITIVIGFVAKVKKEKNIFL